MTTITNSINNTIGASNSGVTNTLTVQNPSNTASSQAQILATVGGATSGDSWNQWTIGSSTSYALGPDNSDGDKLKLNYSASASVDPSSGTNLFTYDPSNGQSTFTNGDLYAQSSDANGLEIASVNTSTSATATATFAAQCAATGAVGAYFNSNVSGDATKNWSSGVLRSDGAWYLHQSTATFGTVPVIKSTTAGAVTFGVADSSTQRSNSGGYVVHNIVNDSNTANSYAELNVQVAGTSAADPHVLYTISGSTQWIQGTDNSDSDKLKISQGTSLGTNDVFVTTTAGEITQPLQPSFCATVSTTVTNVTGDSTAYTVIFNTEDFDQNADYNNATGVFTAPVTGRYLFSANVMFGDLAAGNTTGQLFLITTAKTYTFSNLNIGAIRNTGNYASIGGSQLVPMTAGDTAFIRVVVSGGALVVDVAGDDVASGASTFSGSLIN